MATFLRIQQISQNPPRTSLKTSALEKNIIQRYPDLILPTTNNQKKTTNNQLTKIKTYLSKVKSYL